jgi:hypothetical protein
MGASVGKFVVSVGKMALKGVTSGVLGAVPFIGSHLADYINSKYAVGGELSVPIGAKPDVPEGTKLKEIKTPAQLKKLIQDFPEEARKAGLTVEKVDAEVKQAKEQMKAIGGMVGNRQSKMKEEVQPVKPLKEKKMSHGGKLTKDVLCDSKIKVDSAKEMGQRPKFEVGGEPDKPKVKKARSQAQLDATKRLVEANRKRHAKK